MLQRMWRYKEKSLTRNRPNKLIKMMKSILMHANPMWRDQRSTNADPKNKSKMK